MNFTKIHKVRRNNNIKLNKNEFYEKQLNHVNSDITILIEKLNNLKKLRKTYEHDSEILKNKILLLKSEEKKIKTKTKNISNSMERLLKVRANVSQEKEKLEKNKKENQIYLIKKSIKNIFKVDKNKYTKVHSINEKTLNVNIKTNTKINKRKINPKIIKEKINIQIEEEKNINNNNDIKNEILYSERIEKNRSMLGLQSLSLNYENLFNKINKNSFLEKKQMNKSFFQRKFNLSERLTPKNKFKNLHINRKKNFNKNLSTSKLN